MSSGPEINPLVGMPVPLKAAQEGSDTPEPSSTDATKDATAKSTSQVEPGAKSVAPKSFKEEVDLEPTKMKSRYYAPADADLDEIDLANPPKPPGDIPRGPPIKPTSGAQKPKPKPKPGNSAPMPPNSAPGDSEN